MTDNKTTNKTALTSESLEQTLKFLKDPQRIIDGLNDRLKNEEWVSKETTKRIEENKVMTREKQIAELFIKAETNLEKKFNVTDQAFDAPCEYWTEFGDRRTVKEALSIIESLEAENQQLKEEDKERQFQIQEKNREFYDLQMAAQKKLDEMKEENKKLKEKVEIGKKHLEKFLAPKQFHESGFINFHCSVCGHEPKKFDDGAKEALNNLKESA